jgi:hypothetical protein
MSTTPIKQRSPTGERSPVVFEWPSPSIAWLWWIPVVLGGMYLADILLHLRTILDSVWLSSDADIDGVLAHMSAEARPGAVMTTGDFPHYETMAFTLLTRSFPLYRVIWKLAPVFFAAVGLGAVAFSTFRAFGRWPAALVSAALVCFAGGGVARITAGGLATVFSIDSHANAIITAAACGAVLVWVVPRIATLTNRQLLTAGAVIGVCGGLPLAGDSLYLAWGLTPLVVVVGLAAWRGPQDGAPRVIAFGAWAVGVTLVTDVAFGAIMRAVGVRGFEPSLRGFLTFVRPNGIITNLNTLIRAMPSLTAGSFYGKSVTSRSELEIMSAALVFAAMLAVGWSVRRRVANSLPRGAGGGDVVGERFVHTTFWITVLVAGLVVFMIGTPNPWTTDGRYLLGPYVGIMALLPLLLERGLGWRLVVTGAASLFILSALYQFNSGVLTEMQAGYQTTGTANAVAAYAKSENVAVGYGYYWNSIDLMWNSDFKVDVFPVQRCQKQLLLCTFNEISISSWDRPHGKVRSMLVVNPRARQVRGREPRFGTPIASKKISDLWIYVYSYDIATKLKHESGLTL